MTMLLHRRVCSKSKLFPVFVGPFLLRGRGSMTRDRTKAWPDPCKQEAPAFPLWATGHRPAFLKGCGRWWAVTTIFRDVMIFQKKIHEIYFMVIYFMRLMMMMMINNQHHHVQKQLQSCLSTGNGQAHVFRTLCANSLGICSTKKESSRQLGGEQQSPPSHQYPET